VKDGELTATDITKRLLRCLVCHSLNPTNFLHTCTDSCGSIANTGSSLRGNNVHVLNFVCFVHALSLYLQKIGFALSDGMQVTKDLSAIMNQGSAMANRQRRFVELVGDGALNLVEYSDTRFGDYFRAASQIIEKGDRIKMFVDELIEKRKKSGNPPTQAMFRLSGNLLYDPDDKTVGKGLAELIFLCNLCTPLVQLIDCLQGGNPIWSLRAINIMARQVSRWETLAMDQVKDQCSQWTLPRDVRNLIGDIADGDHQQLLNMYSTDDREDYSDNRALRRKTKSIKGMLVTSTTLAGEKTATDIQSRISHKLREGCRQCLLRYNAWDRKAIWLYRVQAFLFPFHCTRFSEWARCFNFSSDTRRLRKRKEFVQTGLELLQQPTLSGNHLEDFTRALEELQEFSVMDSQDFDDLEHVVLRSQICDGIPKKGKTAERRKALPPLSALTFVPKDFPLATIAARFLEDELGQYFDELCDRLEDQPEDLPGYFKMISTLKTSNTDAARLASNVATARQSQKKALNDVFTFWDNMYSIHHQTHLPKLAHAYLNMSTVTTVLEGSFNHMRLVEGIGRNKQNIEYKMLEYRLSTSNLDATDIYECQPGELFCTSPLFTDGRLRARREEHEIKRRRSDREKEAQRKKLKVTVTSSEYNTIHTNAQNRNTPITLPSSSISMEGNTFPAYTTATVATATPTGSLPLVPTTSLTVTSTASTTLTPTATTVVSVSDRRVCTVCHESVVYGHTCTQCHQFVHTPIFSPSCSQYLDPNLPEAGFLCGHCKSI